MYMIMCYTLPGDPRTLEEGICVSQSNTSPQGWMPLTMPRHIFPHHFWRNSCDRPQPPSALELKPARSAFQSSKGPKSIHERQPEGWRRCLLRWTTPRLVAVFVAFCGLALATSTRPAVRTLLRKRASGRNTRDSETGAGPGRPSNRGRARCRTNWPPSEPRRLRSELRATTTEPPKILLLRVYCLWIGTGHGRGERRPSGGRRRPANRSIETRSRRRPRPRTAGPAWVRPRRGA
mmetsp:Transcript_43466/g.80899  ORF Transcript_43466/g.80899 Transcript_43466/m.80899 type:complete len:235 (-) Transcript_43466:25-729(-)